MERLNLEGKKNAKLLRDKDLVITLEAEELLAEMDEVDMQFLHSKLIRTAEERKPRESFLAQKKLSLPRAAL